MALVPTLPGFCKVYNDYRCREYPWNILIKTADVPSFQNPETRRGSYREPKFFAATITGIWRTASTPRTAGTIF